MSLDLYAKIKVIGKGSYGEVWLAKHRKDKKQYVLKKLELKNASKKERKAAEQEAKLLSKLKHPNIVSYKDSFETGNGLLYIAMGYCEGGDLYSRLKEQRGRALEERRIVEWYVQISMALQYMHERNILHRDLKTQNIFLTKSNIIKLGDLGIARVLESPSDMANTLIGTPYYMSPELFSNRPYNHKSDVWALGCCVYEMATLKHAFNAKDMNSLVYKILRGKMPAMPKMYTAALIQLIKAMLNQNPDKRPSVNRILRDPYIKKNIAEFLEGTKKSRSRPSSSRSNRAERGSNLVRPAGVDVTDNSRSAAKAQDKDKNRSKISIDNDLEPLQVGPDLEPICEVEDEEEPRRVSNGGRPSNGNRSENPRPSSGAARSSADRDARRPSYDRDQYKPGSKSKDNKASNSASRNPNKPSSARDRQEQPASKRNDRSPDSRSVKSERSTNANSRSKDSARSERKLSPTPYRSRASPSPRRSKDKSPRRSSDDTAARKSKNSKAQEKSSDSRSNSRSPPPPRQLPPTPKGHYRSGSDPLFPGKAESPTPSRRRAGSDRSSMGSPSQSEEGSVMSSSRSSIGDSKPRLYRRKKKKSTPSSGDEPDPIAISCDSMDGQSRKASDYMSHIVRDGGYRGSGHRDSGVGLREPDSYVSEAYVHRPKIASLKKVESEPVLRSYRDESTSEQDIRVAPRPLPLLPPPHPSLSSATPAQSSSREARGAGRGVTESGYSSSSSSVHSSAGDSRPMSARARRREQKTLEETPRTNRSVDLSRKSMEAFGAGRGEDQYRSADYSKAQSHAKRLNNQPGDQLDCTDGFEPIIEQPVAAGDRKDKSRANLGPRHRQPSVGDSSSSDAEDEETARVEEKRNAKEMDNFISVLSTTLRLNAKPPEEDDDDVDDVAVVEVEEEEPAQATPPQLFNGATYFVKAPSQKAPHIVIDAGTQELEEDDTVASPSADPQFAYPSATGKVTIPVGRTMTTTGRLWERITVLRKDCIRGLGVEKLKRAYDILDNIGSDSVETQLTALLGRDDFEAYAGKIWQLKFCEEAAFGLV